jgi:hypothetical protein
MYARFCCGLRQASFSSPQLFSANSTLLYEAIFKLPSRMAHHETHPPTPEECQQVALNITAVSAEVERLSKEVMVRTLNFKLFIFEMRIFLRVFFADDFFKRPVRLVAVSKFKDPLLIQACYDVGHRTFGENYVQEIVEKAKKVSIEAVFDEMPRTDVFFVFPVQSFLASFRHPVAFYWEFTKK